MHAVEAAEEGGFAAAAGADDGGDRLGLNLEGDVRENLVGGEPGIQALHVEGDAGSGRGRSAHAGPEPKRAAGLSQKAGSVVSWRLAHLTGLALPFRG